MAMAKPSQPLAPTVWTAVAAEARLGGEHLEEAAGADDAGVAAGGVGDRAVADHVVADDDRAGAGEAQRPGEIVGVAALVGVDEDEVEGAVEGGQRVEGRAGDQLDPVGEAGAGDVRARHLGVPPLGLQGDEPAALGKGAGEPDRRVAAEGADLEDAAGARHAGEEVQELALQRRDVDRRQPRCRIGGERRREGRVVSDEELRQIAVHPLPVRLHRLALACDRRLRRHSGRIPAPVPATG